MVREGVREERELGRKGLAKDEEEVGTAACSIYVGLTSNFLTPPAARQHCGAGG